METPRLQISPGLRRMLDYPKFGGTTRLLILRTGYFFDRGWTGAARQLGWEVAEVRSAMTGSVPRSAVEQLFTVLCEFKPDFILTSNFAGMDQGGLFPRFFEDARIPYVSWFTDTPRMILYDRPLYPSPYIVAAVWERQYLAHFERLGFTHVLYLPLCTDPELFDGAFEPAPRRRLAFVGHSMIGLAEEAWDKLREAPSALDALEAAFANNRVDRQRFSQGIEAILGNGAAAGWDARTRRHVELAMVYEATRRQREAMAKHLEPFGIEVRGDPRWAEVAPGAGGSLGYFDALAPYYRDTAINLNVTSLQMATAVNQRVFDCPAAGGFLLTDAQADLEELFDAGREAVAYHTLDELGEKVRYYLQHPDARRTVVEAAQRRIRAHHTHAHRLSTLRAWLEARFA